MNSAKEIKQNSISEIVISKSKFIAYSFAVHNLEEIKQILADLQSKYKDATHVCYAYKIFGAEKCSDDGEPQGTAGKPILDCIKKCGFENILVAVVRYFGGVKLGAGGLVRAYSNSASNVLALSGENLTYKCKKLTFCLDISETKLANQIKQISIVKDAKIIYSEKITMEVFCFEEDVENLKIQIKNLLNRNINFEIDDKKYFV